VLSRPYDCTDRERRALVALVAECERSKIIVGITAATREELASQVVVLASFVAKVADYSNDGWLAREASVLVRDVPGPTLRLVDE
jgi:hypothetical protein